MAMPSTKNTGVFGVEILACCPMSSINPLDCKPTETGCRHFRSEIGKPISTKPLMKPAVWTIAFAVVVATAGCGAKNQPAQVAAEQLQKSFQKADASITAEVV